MAERFLEQLRRAERDFAHYLEGHCARLDLAPADGRMLAYLEARGPCPIGELQAIFGFKPSTLTTVVDRLADHRLVSRKPNPADRRSVLVVLTGTGRALAERVQGLLDVVDGQVLRATTEADRAGFARVLGAIAEATDHASVSQPG
ncbi:MAG: MarR family transcriptional regulator [Gemmatimonadota bacterium]